MSAADMFDDDLYPSALRDRPPAGPIVTALGVGFVLAAAAGAGIMVAALRVLGRWAK